MGDTFECPYCGTRLKVYVEPDTLSKSPPATYVQDIDNIKKNLSRNGQDLSKVDIFFQEGIIIVRPKQYLGELWGGFNKTLRALGLIWNKRDGHNGRWESVP